MFTYCTVPFILKKKHRCWKVCAFHGLLRVGSGGDSLLSGCSYRVVWNWVAVIVVSALKFLSGAFKTVVGGRWASLCVVQSGPLMPEFQRASHFHLPNN